MIYTPGLRIDISPTLKIRAVIANENIKKGQLIESCPIILYENRFEKLIDQTSLGNYNFRWDEKFDCILLGFGSIYNHSFNPNSIYKQNYLKKEMEFVAIRDIAKNEEIFINYNGDPDDKTPLDPGYEDFDATQKG